MEKTIPVGSWTKMAEAPAEVIKVSSRGLIGFDRKQFLEKRAGMHVFADLIDGIKLADGDIPIHLNAIGSTEGFGANRNGDGFCEATCIAQHDTFRKSARYYQHHKNNDPSKSYGCVKLSAYNPQMRRVELFVIGNATKEAAERNGGLVLPQRSIDRLYGGDALGWSMACKIAYDVCSNCFNKSASRATYCTEDTCINPHNGRRMPGCRDGLTKLGEDGFQQYVENPRAHFFDISEVGKPADPTAYGGIADYMLKAASAGRVIGGAELAEKYAAENGFTLLPAGVSRELELISQLADAERRLSGTLSSKQAALLWGLSAVEPLNVSQIGEFGTVKSAAVLAEFAREGVILSPAEFAEWLMPKQAAELIPGMQARLPNIYTKLAAADDLAALVQNNPFSGEPEVIIRDRRWAKTASATRALDISVMASHAQRAVIEGRAEPETRTKTAAALDAGDAASHLAVGYALYKVASLALFPTNAPQLPLTLELAILQNRASN